MANMHLKGRMLQVVDNQLQENNPAITKITYSMTALNCLVQHQVTEAGPKLLHLYNNINVSGREKHLWSARNYP